MAVRSLLDIIMIPMSEAKTPKSLRQVNFSMWVNVPMSSVQIAEVEVRMVVDATVVYCRQAIAK